jgi:GntR family transcriptional regulator of vanillate catabolism
LTSLTNEHGLLESIQAVIAQIEIQSALEGLSARWAAERGASAEHLAAMRECLGEIEDLLAERDVSDAGITRYARLNTTFHRSLSEVSRSAILNRHASDDLVTLFAMPQVRRALVLNPAQAATLMLIEQDQHHRIVEAIERGLGTSAENLVREHAWLPRRHLVGHQNHAEEPARDRSTTPPRLKGDR